MGKEWDIVAFAYGGVGGGRCPANDVAPVINYVVNGVAIVQGIVVTNANQACQVAIGHNCV